VSDAEANRASIDGRIRSLMAQLDTLLEGADAAARLVACGRAAIPALRDFLIEGRPRGVYQPRLWAAQALAGLGAENVLIEYLRRPIASEDAVARFGEQTVRSAAAKALAEVPTPEARSVLYDVASNERLPGALEALALSDPVRATPILIDALGDDFARDAAAAALQRIGDPVRTWLIDVACDVGERPQATMRRRLAALDLLRDFACDRDDWRRLERVLDDREPQLVCAVSLLGVERSSHPEHIARRLLEVLPHVGWEWLGTVEDIIVRCAERAGDRFRPLFPIEGADVQTLATWRRICRRLGIDEL
jgi:hypothetical protein